MQVLESMHLGFTTILAVGYTTMYDIFGGLQIRNWFLEVLKSRGLRRRYSRFNSDQALLYIAGGPLLFVS